MSKIAGLAAALRQRIIGSAFSSRRIADRAGVGSSTVRDFMRTGSATVRSLDRIESALDELDRERSAGGGADDPEHPVPPHSRKQMAACHE